MPRTSDLTRAVVRTVAEHEEVPPTDLPPLEEYVDSEIFHQLAGGGSPPTDGLEFSFLWYQIEVEAGKVVSIDP